MREQHASYHLAQTNIGRWRVPPDGPEAAQFMALLDPINAIADRSPGFVWRLQTEAGNATSIPVFDDPLVMINLSVWESVETLRRFTYETRHLDVLRRRREWFERMEVFQAMWWVPAGTLPTVADAERRITLLREIGPSPDAFTFRESFPPASAREESLRGPAP